MVDGGEGRGAKRPDQQFETLRPRRQRRTAAETTDGSPDRAAGRSGDDAELEEPSSCRARTRPRTLRIGCGSGAPSWHVNPFWSVGFGQFQCEVIRGWT